MVIDFFEVFKRKIQENFNNANDQAKKAAQNIKLENIESKSEDGKQKVDVAVGPDPKPKKENFFYFFLMRKKPTETDDDDDDQFTYDEKSHAVDVFVHGLQREAMIVTREVIASSFSSVIAVLFSNPFDVVKSKFQLSRPSRNVQQTTEYRRQRFLYIFRDIYARKGFRGFYKKHKVRQRESLFQAVSMFWTYQRLRQYFEENFEHLNENCAIFMSGFLSATIPVMILHPYYIFDEHLNSKRIIKQKHGKLAAIKLAKEVTWRRWRPISRTSFPMFIHMGTQYGLRFMFYHQIRNELAQRKTTNDKATDTNPKVTEVESIINLTYFEILMAGACAAILGDILAHPLDVIQSRVAMTTLVRQQFRYHETCRHIFQCIKLIWQKEGIRAFYGGLMPCIIRSAVNTSLQFAAYDEMRYWLRPLFSL